MDDATRTVEPDAAPRAVESVELLMLGDDAVLIDENHCRTELLNATGAVVWQCFNGESTVGEIADDLAVVFDVDADIVTADITSLVHQLARMRLIEFTGVDSIPEAEHDIDMTTGADDSCPDFDAPTEQLRPDFLTVPPNP